MTFTPMTPTTISPRFHDFRRDPRPDGFLQQTSGLPGGGSGNPGGPGSASSVGRSGSGKTTLLRALNRLNECFPGCRTQGQVLLQFPEGGEVDAYDARTDVELLRRRVGMVFQSPNVLPVSIGRNLLMPLKLVAGVTGSKAEARMEQALRDVGLWDEVAERLSHAAATLSGGQQQRLCLARALALEPELLLLDEPTASVDYRSAEIIENLLQELAKRLTVVMVSHSLSQDPPPGPSGGSDA